MLLNLLQNLSSKLSSRTRLSLVPLEDRAVPAVYDLGQAADFNVFVRDDINVYSSDVEGRVAAGDDATFLNYGIGTGLPNSNGTRDDLIVGDALSYTNGQVFNGNIVYGSTAVLTNVGIPNGSERQETGVVDFTAIESHLLATAATLGAEGHNMVTRLRGTNLTLAGTHPELNIFSVTAAQLAASRRITINVPVGSTTLINVRGTLVNLNNVGLRLFGGANSSTILWNMFQATSVNMSAIQMRGSILAPNADVNFTNGEMYGTLAARSLTGNGQFHMSNTNVRITLQDPSTLGGFAFLDADQSGTRDDPSIEVGVGGQDVFVTGVDYLGRAVFQSYNTDDDGSFQFTTLRPGAYRLTITPTSAFSNFNTTGIPGTIDGFPVGTGGIFSIEGINIGSNQNGIDYLFPLFREGN